MEIGDIENIAYNEEKPMTFLELRDSLNKLPKADLDCPVKVIGFELLIPVRFLAMATKDIYENDLSGDENSPMGSVIVNKNALFLYEHVSPIEK